MCFIMEAHCRNLGEALLSISVLGCVLFFPYGRSFCSFCLGTVFYQHSGSAQPCHCPFGLPFPRSVIQLLFVTFSFLIDSLFLKKLGSCTFYGSTPRRLNKFLPLFLPTHTFHPATYWQKNTTHDLGAVLTHYFFS